MADSASPAVVIDEPVDVDMGDSAPAAEAANDDVEITGSNTVAEGDNPLPFAEGGEDEDVKVPARMTYVDFLSSPIVELHIGQGEEKTVLTAHQAQLVKSPWMQEACAQFAPDAVTRVIELPDDPLDAVACFLEYLYTNEYFPQKIPHRGEHFKLVSDPTLPETDTTGEQLLKHARVYVLAGKMGMDKLKELAHSKVHCVKSSAKGEIAYARYVYATTSAEDETIRKPVASFWAHRSHVLRAEAETEFRQMCLEFPQFSFDVITRLLDEKAKNEAREKPSSGTPAASSRKRQRQSQIL